MMTRCDVTFESPWPIVEARPSWMACSSVEASRLELQAIEYACRVVCVAEKAWILHKFCLVCKDEPRLRLDEATNSSKNVNEV